MGQNIKTTDVTALGIQIESDKINPPTEPPKVRFLDLTGDMAQMMFVGIPPKEKGKVFALELVEVEQDKFSFNLVEIDARARV